MADQATSNAIILANRRAAELEALQQRQEAEMQAYHDANPTESWREAQYIAPTPAPVPTATGTGMELRKEGDAAEAPTITQDTGQNTPVPDNLPTMRTQTINGVTQYNAGSVSSSGVPIWSSTTQEAAAHWQSQGSPAPPPDSAYASPSGSLWDSVRAGVQNVGDTVSSGLQAIGDLATGGGTSSGATGTSGGTGDGTRLGDRMPEPPNYSETPTGVQSPTTAAGDTTVAGAGQGIIAAESARAQGEYQGLAADKATADALAAGIRGDTAEFEGLIDQAHEDMDEAQVQYLTSLKDAQENFERIPVEITTEFDRLRTQFDRAASDSFNRIDGQRGAALAEVNAGRSAALQAAVQGIQGSVNTQVAQIMANGSLTQSQKQSMVSQVKLNGATAIAPVIGQSVLAFNQLSTQVHTHFASLTGQLEVTGLSGKAQLVGLSGEAYAQAKTVVGQLTTQLLDMTEGSNAAHANAQSQLLATRAHATLTGNNTLLQLLPEQGTPYLDLTGSAVAAYEIGADILKSQFAMDLQTYGMELQIAAMRSMQGDPASNILEGIVSGFIQGEIPGAILGGVASAVGNINTEWV